MKKSAKDEFQGKAHELKGTVVEKAGVVTGDPILEREGHNEKVAGSIQKKFGQIEKVLGK